MIEIVRPGMQATIQDLGRWGFGHLGVPEAGATDPKSLRLSNRLVGNPEGAAAIEFLLGGLAVRFHCQRAFAISGAPVDLRINGRPAEAGQWQLARDGDLVVAGRVGHGLRSYLAIAGGIDVAPVLGSRSTDTLSGLGPDALELGDRLDLGSPGPQAPAVDVVMSTISRPPVELRVDFHWGPRDDRFTSAARRALVGSTFMISPEVDRIAARLDGPALEFSDRSELATEGLALGSIQVPPSGRPIIHLANHPPTGGYAVIGVVTSDDVATLSQCPPGTRIRFRPLARTGSPF
ncbi:biotin-dependent carboxyltransferase family protein [Mycolicibacterium sediminis]|uniref:Allophanate hydrolase n=2 Tax=Mycolicibacterium sediminis TaxID=1286180 RepID=A0A7I7QRD0_9MYCO|nr:allophanate hydrolase [Mycolicibacterium sediminis]